MDTEVDHLRNIEHKRLRSLVDGDIALAKQLHADNFQLITPIGELLSKEQYLAAIASGYIKYLLWEPETIDVRIYGNAAVIRYQSQLELIFSGHKVPSSRYWHTDVYEKHEGNWQVVWSQATEIK
ncbi:MAG TPA: nuclear transport factor 2 family protein [Gammaproteobacteria bacterium]|nr:nuclear transport factor 2 family protein [Gammaproteobacteria bacterium]